jgi:signal peptidase I
MTTPTNPSLEPTPDWLTSLQSLLATIVIAVFVITYIVQAFQIPSPSMENTLLTGDYLLVDKLCYGGGGVADHIIPYRPIRRGDIIVFHYPVNPAQHFVKRVVGVPGDRVRLVNKRVFVNGMPVAEPYVRYFKTERNPFPASRRSGSRNQCRLVGADAQTGGERSTNCAGRSLLRDGR